MEMPKKDLQTPNAKAEDVNIERGSSDDNERASVRDRRLRRYHRARSRRLAEARSDNAFYRAVFSLAGIGAALAIGLAVMGLTGGPQDVSALSGWLQPWLGSLSKMDVLGLVVIAGLALLTWRRMRQR